METKSIDGSGETDLLTGLHEVGETNPTRNDTTEQETVDGEDETKNDTEPQDIDGAAGTNSATESSGIGMTGRDKYETVKMETANDMGEVNFNTTLREGDGAGGTSLDVTSTEGTEEVILSTEFTSPGDMGGILVAHSGATESTTTDTGGVTNQETKSQDIEVHGVADSHTELMEVDDSHEAADKTQRDETSTGENIDKRDLDQADEEKQGTGDRREDWEVTAEGTLGNMTQRDPTGEMERRQVNNQGVRDQWGTASHRPNVHTDGDTTDGHRVHPNRPREGSL